MGSTARTMQAAQWDPKQQKIIVNDLPIPEAGPGQFLVKITAASLCHSDIMAIEAPDREEPITLGHEGVGVIEKIDAAAANRGFKVGDTIGFLYIIGACFECEACQHHNLLCESGKQQLQGFTTAGFFAEYAVVDWQNAIILPKNLDVKTSSPLFCAGITSFHAVDSCDLKPGQWLGVIGAGGLGQLATQYAKAMGANVLAIDVNDTTLLSTKAQGADAIFNSRSNPSYADEIKNLTNGGVHAAAVFSNAKQAYASAPSIIRTGGMMMIVGIAHEPLQISTMDLALQKYKIKSESTSIPQRMPKAIDFTAKHNISPAVDLRKGLHSLAGMVEEMKSGKATKRMAILFD